MSKIEPRLDLLNIIAFITGIILIVSLTPFFPVHHSLVSGLFTFGGGGLLAGTAIASEVVFYSINIFLPGKTNLSRKTLFFIILPTPLVLLFLTTLSELLLSK